MLLLANRQSVLVNGVSEGVSGFSDRSRRSLVFPASHRAALTVATLTIAGVRRHVFWNHNTNRTRQVTSPSHNALPRAMITQGDSRRQINHSNNHRPTLFSPIMDTFKTFPKLPGVFPDLRSKYNCFTFKDSTLKTGRCG